MKKYTVQGNLVIGEKGKKAKSLVKGDQVELSQEYLDANPHLIAMLTPHGHDAEKAEKKPEAKAEPKSDDKKFEKKKPTGKFSKNKPTKAPAKVKKASTKKKG